MIDTNKCVFEKSSQDNEYGTVYYFIYPKCGMDETEFYSEEDYGNVVSTCISLTIAPDGYAYMQMSPTVENDDMLSDVDWRDLYKDENYDDSTINRLLKIVKEN